MPELRGPGSAEDILNDPVYQARIARRNAEDAARTAVWREAERQLVTELQEAGYPVETAWMLYKYKPHISAIPILLDHLPRDYPERVRWGIAGALVVREARQWWQQIRDLYVVEAGPEAKPQLANALAEIVTTATLDSYIELLRDASNASSRILLVRGLTRLRDQRAADALKELASDPVLSISIGDYFHKKALRDSKRDQAR
jgi:hypothetical protein